MADEVKNAAEQEAELVPATTRANDPLYKDGPRDSRAFDDRGNLVGRSDVEPEDSYSNRNKDVSAGHAAQPGPTPANVIKPQLRAAFKVTEIHRTSLGIARIVLAAQHESMNTFLDFGNPKGNIVIEVDQKAADSIPLGASFALSSI